MSYSIYIGEAVPYVYEDVEDRVDFEVVHVTVDRMEHPEAPTFPNDDLTGSSNGRHPGYSQWADFSRLCGLHVVLVEGWIKHHPGAILLTREHLARIKTARESWQAVHPNAVPGFGRNEFTDEGVRLVDGHLDSVLARLLWLEWWCAYALANCRIPTVCNS